MAVGLRSAAVAVLAAGQGADQVELTHGWQAVLARGGQPVLVSTADRQVELAEPSERPETMRVDVRVADADPADYAGLLLPGGAVNADQLRTSPEALAFVRGFFAAGLPVAAICRAPFVLIAAGVVADRRLTSWPSLRTELRQAGASWVTDHVVVCDRGPNALVTSRSRSDLPYFCQTFTQRFAAFA